MEELLSLLKQIVERLDRFEARLDRIEKQLAISVEKEAYEVEEVAERLKRRPFTVRQWCNQGKAKAKKVRGKGRTGEWRIPHAEVVRLQNEGPALLGTFRNHTPAGCECRVAYLRPKLLPMAFRSA